MVANQDQVSRAQAFHALHRQGDPLTLVNIWDAGSAAVVAKAGYAAIGTSSYSVAETAGYRDGEKLPAGELSAAVARIVRVISRPLTVDIEAGLAIAPAEAGHTAEAIIDAVRRAAIYRKAGADGFFVPGLVDTGWITRLVNECGLPVNIMLSAKAARVGDLAKLGVARICLGPWPLEFARNALTRVVDDFAKSGDAANFLSV